MSEIQIEKKMNVESFNLDHTKVKAPYVRLACVTAISATKSTNTTCASASPIKTIWKCLPCIRWNT